jgi:hypothetical protein
LDRQGELDTFQAWIVLWTAITPNHPDGNLAAPGQTSVHLGLDSASVTSERATGPGLCNDAELDVAQANFPPYLHIGGPVSSWEQCNGSYNSG